MIDENSTTILAITLDDYKNIGALALLRKEKISSVLALDDETIAFAISKHIPFHIYEDFLDEKDLDNICAQVNLYSSRCLENIKEVVKDNIDYSLLDKECFLQMFNELCFSKKIAEYLLADNKNLLVIKRNPSIIFEYLCGDKFANAALTLNSPNIQIIKARSSSLYSLPKGEWDPNIDIHNKVVVVVNSTFEIDRHYEFFQLLNEQFPEKICILSIGRYHGKFDLFPIYSTPIFSNFEKDNSFLPILNYNDERFYFDRTLLPHFKEILQYICSYRWPNIASAFHRFKSLFNTQKPLCIIGTTLNDAESQIALIAAKQLNIKTYAWQHSLAHGTFPYYKADKIFIASKFAYRIAKAAGEKNIFPVKDVDSLVNLYKLSNSKIYWHSNGKYKILILPAACKYYGSSCMLNNFKKINEFAEKILIPPANLREKLDIRFKAHPGFPCQAFYNTTQTDFSQYFFSKDASLIELLNQADCCILLGEYGCAVVHSCMRVPTLFYETNFYLNPTIRNIMKEFPHYYTCIDDIWKEINKLIQNSQYRYEFLERQKGWGNFDQQYPSFVDIIHQDLQANKI